MEGKGIPEAEAGGLQPGLQGETLSPKTKTKPG